MSEMNSEINASSPAASEEITDARQQFEAEKLTRRSALKKFGITSGMALFGMFAVDDLARMVGTELHRRASDNQVAEQIAHEFQGAGVAFADSSSSDGCSDCTPECGCSCLDCTSTCTCQKQICVAGCPSSFLGDICRIICGFTAISCNTNCPPA